MLSLIALKLAYLPNPMPVAEPHLMGEIRQHMDKQDLTSAEWINKDLGKLPQHDLEKRFAEIS